MRLFYDEYTSPKRADIVLLFSDCLAIVCAFLFVTGSPFYAHESVWDACLLAVWAIIPRNIAKFLTWLGRPREFVVSFGMSLLFVVIVTLLLVAGWEILDLMMANEQPIREGSAILVLVTWGCGFLLCHPRSYRLHDFLLGSVMLLGLLQRMPATFLWLPLFLLGMGLSATCRHLLFDVFPGVRRARLNLQNVRSLSLVFALAGVTVFAVSYAALYPLLDRQVEQEAIASGKGRNWFSWGRGAHRASSPQGWSGLFGSDDESEGNDERRGEARDEYGMRGGVPSEDGDPLELEDPDGAEGGQSRRQIAFSHQVRLQDLAAPRYDSRKVFRVRVETPPNEPVSLTSAIPSRSTLWKVLCFSEFDAPSATWTIDTSYGRGEWDEDDTYTVPAENAGTWSREAHPVWLRVDVLQPVFRNLVSTYAPVRLGPVFTPPEGAGAGSDPRSTSAPFFLRNTFGDVVPVPPLRAGSSYYTLVRLSGGGMQEPPGQDYGTHEDPRYLQLPPAEITHVDLVSYAREVLSGARSVQDKVTRLLRHYSRNFLRSNATTWRGQGDHLKRFLVRERVGDCTYFSTATALLLRAGGVSTRLAVGFVGCDREDGQTYAVRNMNAHGWVEVYLPGRGWFPIDPTAWAPPAQAKPGDFRRGFSNDPFDPRPQGFDDPGEAPDEPRALEPELAQNDQREVRPVAPLTTGSEIPDPEAGSEDGASGERIASRAGAGGFSSFFPEGFFDRRDETDVSNRDERGDLPPRAASAVRDPERTARFLKAAIVRVVLVTLGSVALLLAVFAFLRPRRKEENEEAESDMEHAVPDPLGLDREPVEDWTPRNEREAVLSEYHRMQVDLARTRTHRQPHQTPVEHGRRFRGRDEELDSAFGVLHRILYRVLYGRRKASSGDVDDVQKQCRTIRRHLT